MAFTVLIDECFTPIDSTQSDQNCNITNRSKTLQMAMFAVRLQSQRHTQEQSIQPLWIQG
jgi:hypothetical protein